MGGQWQVISGLSHAFPFLQVFSAFCRFSHVTLIMWRGLPMLPRFGFGCLLFWLVTAVPLWGWWVPVCLRGHKLDKLNQRQILQACSGTQIWEYNSDFVKICIFLGGFFWWERLPPRPDEKHRKKCGCCSVSLLIQVLNCHNFNQCLNGQKLSKLSKKCKVGKQWKKILQFL